MIYDEIYYMLRFIEPEQWASAIRYSRQRPDVIEEATLRKLVEDVEKIYNINLQEEIKFNLGEK